MRVGARAFFGRLLRERAAYPLDYERVLEAVRDRPCYLEINAQPLRLDLEMCTRKPPMTTG